MGRTKRSIPDRFWAKVREAGECWEWTGAQVTGGYGYFGIDRGVGVMAHRFAYEQMVHQVPEGLSLDHLCRNAQCVNPYHLEPVPIRVNILRSDGLCAKNARKTHCDSGHPLSGDNLYIRKHGWRACRECQRASDRARYQRMKAARS